jgi:signal transduction histidine kinase/ActR/RegA family two-component response regulator
MIRLLAQLFDTADFPPRWYSGNWTPVHGWLHIFADLGVWSAFVAISGVLLYHVSRRRELRFRWILWLFAALMLACGMTHFMEAVMFWWPAYRLAGSIKIVTAVVSWATVVALIRVAPRYLALPNPIAVEQELLSEADRRKDDFLAILGHELRNPLAGIVSASQVLEMVGSKDPPAQEMRAIIHRQSQIMGRLIDDLLDVSRIARGKLQLRTENVDWVDLVRRTCADFRPRAESSELALQVHLPSHPLWIRGDPTRLSQMLMNLLQNALKFTNQGGHVTITLTEDSASRTCRLIVRDTGIGMDEATLARIFEPFRQAEDSVERSHGGLGLGLALVKGLAELQGATVSAFSPGRDRGAEFSIQFPLIPPAEPSSTAEAHAGSERCFRVLIIDDSRDASYPLQALLKRMGHHAEVAEDGNKGLQIAKQFRPELVLCDIGLPGEMSGYDVAQALRSDPDCCHAYLVAVTGYGQDEDRRRTGEAGFQLHLIKPVGMPDLRELLASLTAARNS